MTFALVRNKFHNLIILFITIYSMNNNEYIFFIIILLNKPNVRYYLFHFLMVVISFIKFITFALVRNKFHILIILFITIYSMNNNEYIFFIIILLNKPNVRYYLFHFLMVVISFITFITFALVRNKFHNLIILFTINFMNNNEYILFLNKYLKYF